MKTCNKCNEEKPLENFYNDRKAKDGKMNACKECMNKQKLEWARNNPEKIKDYNKRNGKKYYETHLEEERERARQKNMREENVLKRKQKYEDNKEEILEAQKKYREENIEVVREKDRLKKARQQASGQDLIWSERRRARKASLPDTLTLEQWNFALAYWNNCCAICKRPFEDAVEYLCAADHWIPLSSEKCPGTTVENMIPLCHGKQGCNNSKTVKLPEDWLLKKFGEEQAKQILDSVNIYFETVRRIQNG